MHDRDVTPGSAVSYWIKLGFTSFGGPAGQIAMMQHELVDRRAWIDQGAFLRGLNYCMLLPGPEAQQLATYIGWRLHGTWGGVVAGLAFILPGALLMMVLAWIAAAHGDAAVIAAAFSGIKPVVIAIIAHAVWRIGRRTINTLPAAGLATGAFIAIHFAGLPFPLIVFVAGAIGVLLARKDAGGPVDADASAKLTGGGGTRLALLVAVCGTLWIIPVAAIVLIGGETFLDVASLFTTAAFVTFGGAYAVLPYIADAGVVVHGWLTPANMIDGLALAETTPGPLILVTTYVGYFAGWNGAAADVFGQGVAAIMAGGLATWVTFLPSFLFILAGAPYIERLNSNRYARGALTAITAAVVGVILNLMVFLASAVFLPPSGIAWGAVAGTVIAFALLVAYRLSVPALVAIGLVAGVGLQLIPWHLGA